MEREQLLAMLGRRPCTLDDLMDALGCHRWEAAKLLGVLAEEGAVFSTCQNGRMYYQARKTSQKSPP